jgi:hypothetical protein
MVDTPRPEPKRRSKPPNPKMPRPKTDTLQLAVRIPRAWLARLDALIPKIAQAGVQTTRTDAIRAALARGLDALEEQFGEPPPQPTPKPRRK